MPGSMVYRTRIRKIDTAQTIKLKSALAKMQAIKDNRGYNFIAGFHGVPGQFCWHHQFNIRNPGSSRLFLPWHRAYLWWLEQAMQDQEDGASLVWWDWSRTRKIPDLYDDPGTAQNPNPLNSVTIHVPSAPMFDGTKTFRTPGPSNSPLLATPEMVEQLLQIQDWPQFSDMLQSYHDGVHVWVGGSMSQVPVAGFDPIFYAHHAMVDRLWYLWQIRHGINNIPFGILDLDLAPFGKTVKDVLEVQQLGYEYADVTTVINTDEWKNINKAKNTN